MAVAEKDGHWYIVQSRPTIVNGQKKYKQKWIPISASSREEAEEQEKNFKERHSKGIKINPNLTIFELSRLWMDQHVKSPVKPLARSTQIFYQSRLDLYIVPTIGAKKIRELSVDDLDEVLSSAAKKGEIDTTIDSIYSTMSAMFGWAKKKRKIAENLMEFVDAPEVAEREYTLLRAEDISKFLEAVLIPGKFDTKYAIDQRYMYYNLFIVELTTALRADEICGIREDDIDFERKILFVRQQVIRSGSKPEFGPAKDRKNQKPDVIPLADITMEALKDEIRAKKLKRKEAEKKGLTWTEYGLVFTNRTGGPVDSKNLNTRTFKAALKRAGLPDMKFHNLRHSVLTILSNSNEDINAICDLARHKDINFFRSRYLHPDVEAQRTAVATLEKLLPPKNKI